MGSKFSKSSKKKKEKWTKTVILTKDQDGYRTKHVLYSPPVRTAPRSLLDPEQLEAVVMYQILTERLPIR